MAHVAVALGGSTSASKLAAGAYHGQGSQGDASSVIVGNEIGQKDYEYKHAPVSAGNLLHGPLAAMETGYGGMPVGSMQPPHPLTCLMGSLNN